MATKRARTASPPQEAPGAAPAKRRARFPPPGEEVASARARDVPIAEHMYQLRRVYDALRGFFNKTVAEVAEDLGHALRGPPETAMRRAVVTAMNQSLTNAEVAMRAAAVAKMRPDPIAPLFETVLNGLSKYGDYTVLNIIREDLAARLADRPLHLFTLVVVRGGLGTFLKYNQCATECHQVLQYRPQPREDLADADLPSEKPLRNFIKTCQQVHRILERMLGVSDLREFDRLLLEASGGKCSVALPPDPRFALRPIPRRPRRSAAATALPPATAIATATAPPTATA